MQGQTFGKMKTASKLAYIFSILAQITDSNILTLDNRHNHLIDGSEENCTTSINYPNIWNKNFANTGIDLSLAGIQDQEIKKEFQVVQDKLQVLYKQMGQYDVLRHKAEKDSSDNQKALAQAHQQLKELHQVLNNSLKLAIKAKKKNVNGSEVLKRQLKMVNGHVPSGVILYKEIAKNKKQRAAVKNYYAKKLKHKLKAFEEGVKGYEEVKRKMKIKIQAAKSKNEKLKEKEIIINDEESLKTRAEIEKYERDLHGGSKSSKKNTRKGAEKRKRIKKKPSNTQNKSKKSKKTSRISENSKNIYSKISNNSIKIIKENISEISQRKNDDCLSNTHKQNIVNSLYSVIDKKYTEAIYGTQHALYAILCKENLNSNECIFMNEGCAYISGWVGSDDTSQQRYGEKSLCNVLRGTEEGLDENKSICARKGQLTYNTFMNNIYTLNTVEYTIKNFLQNKNTDALRKNFKIDKYKNSNKKKSFTRSERCKILKKEKESRFSQLKKMYPNEDDDSICKNLQEVGHTEKVVLTDYLINDNNINSNNYPIMIMYGREPMCADCMQRLASFLKEGNNTSITTIRYIHQSMPDGIVLDLKKK